MKRLASAAGLFVGLAGPAWAQFQDGVTAYERSDDATAFEIFQPLAEQGNIEALSFLGRLYLHGRGVRRDHAEAGKWRRRAAEQGDTPARFVLGAMYSGLVPESRAYFVDLVRAHEWYSLAPKSGHRAGAERRDIPAMLMSAAQIAEVRRLARASKPKAG